MGHTKYPITVHRAESFSSYVHHCESQFIASISIIMSNKKMRLCDPSTSHDKCPTCIFNSFNIPSYSKTTLMKLLSSNDPPPDAIRASIASHREALREASTALKDLMSATKSILTRIEETDAVVNTALDDMSAILHPIRSFPDEILSIIFHLCVPSTDINVVDTKRGVINHIIDSLCTSSPPWSLSYVCRGWRALVLSSPTLWSTLCIPLDVHAHAPHPQVSFRLALYLQRSENRELDVYLQEIELFDKFLEDGRVADLT